MLREMASMCVYRRNDSRAGAGTRESRALSDGEREALTKLIPSMPGCDEKVTVGIAKPSDYRVPAPAGT